MAQNKTKIPYFDRPDKCIASEQGLKTKLFAAIVHGFGVYLFWCTALIQTGSNLTIEVLRRTLNKIEAEQGFLPPILHLQLDNASDNKSKQFLAFIAYLVENRVFNVVKLSYLIVAHTHADVDQYLSCCSRFFRRIMQTIFSVCLNASATRMLHTQENMLKVPIFSQSSMVQDWLLIVNRQKIQFLKNILELLCGVSRRRWSKIC